MNEVHSPKKPLIFYYMVAMLLVMLFNFIAMPWLSQYQIQEVDYNTFVSMVEKKEIGKVDIQEQENRILFTDTEEKTIYKTAMVPDDDLVSRLLEAGHLHQRHGDPADLAAGEYSGLGAAADHLHWTGADAVPQSHREMGGGNSMMFNMGKSNAKVYVKSAEGIKFDDVAGEDEPRRTSPRSSTTCTTPASIRNRRVDAQGHHARRPSGNR